MAEKQGKPDPQLGMIVAELRKLNAVSKKDLIREKEIADRAERVAASAEVAEEQQSTIIDGAQDFQRRFLAGQAKTLVDKGKIGAPDDDDKPATRLQAEELATMFKDRWKALDSAKGEADREANAKKDKDDKKAGGGDKGGKSGILKNAAKAAGGMALLGLGIGGFMSGLMVWSNIKAFKGEGFPDQAKNVAEGLDEFGKMSNKSIATLGVMLAGGAFLGMVGGVGKSSKAAIGMTTMGAGIGGFMTGIVAAGDLTGFKGDVFAAQAVNLSAALEALGDLSTAQVATLGTIAAGGALMAASRVGIGTTTLAAGGAAIAGAGLGGFMTGIAAPGDIGKFTGTTFKDQAINTVAAIKALETIDDTILITLGGLAAGGALMASTRVGIGTVALAAAGASLAGAGIGGFMVGIAGAGKLGSMAGVDGSSFKNQAKNIAEGIGSFTDKQQKAMVGFITVGAGLGLATGGIGNVAAAAGMTAFGAGIGGFFGAMAGVGKLFEAVGVDGTGLRTIMENLGGGLAGFNDVKGENLVDVGLGLGSLGIGIAGLGTALFGTGTADTIGDAVDGVKNIFNWEWLSGKKDKDTSASGLENLIAGIVSPMKMLAEVPNETYSQAATGIDSVVKALNAYNGLKIQTGPKFADLADDFVLGAHAIDIAMNGGKYQKPGLMNDITVATGIKNITALQYDTAANGILALQHALTGYDGNPVKSNNGTNGGVTVINNNDNSSQTTILQKHESPDFSVGDGISTASWPGGRELPAGGLRMGY
jgi:hypothetical protein|tara:strand:+ start:10635 stop:12923 length:2289 start_codon:yes stop_codon:yes gene_type:complete